MVLVVFRAWFSWYFGRGSGDIRSVVLVTFQAWFWWYLRRGSGGISGVVLVAFEAWFGFYQWFSWLVMKCST